MVKYQLLNMMITMMLKLHQKFRRSNVVENLFLINTGNYDIKQWTRRRKKFLQGKRNRSRCSPGRNKCHHRKSKMRCNLLCTTEQQEMHCIKFKNSNIPYKQFEGKFPLSMCHIDSCLETFTDWQQLEWWDVFKWKKVSFRWATWL